MGDWSDFFEDFPEFNPGNYIGNDFAPQRAAELRKFEAWAAAKLQAEQAELDNRILAVIRRHAPGWNPPKHRRPSRST